MADSSNVSAPFPQPPPFHQHFTSDNLRQLKQLKSESKDTNGTQDATNGLLALPPELRFLVPPQPPTDGKYRSFGVANDLNAPDQSLSDAGIEQLYPSTAQAEQNPVPHILGLSRSLLTTFLSLVGILSQDPTQYSQKTEDLQTIMYNIHHLINIYRPHQARESLILTMEERVEKMRKEVADTREAQVRVSEVLRNLQRIGLENGTEREAGSAENTNIMAEDETRRARQRSAWAALDAQFASSPRANLCESQAI